MASCRIVRGNFKLTLLLGGVLLLRSLEGVQSLEVPPLFMLDLSLPPQDRWNGAVQMILDRHPWEYSFGAVFAGHAQLFNALTASNYVSLARAIRVHWPETAGELEGIALQFARIGHPEVSFQYLAAWHYYHELAHSDIAPQVPVRECTGIIVQKQDGSIVHGANMDQQPEQVRNLTLQLHVVDGSGATVFRGVDWYAILSTGVSRAVRQHFASVQENWRSTHTLSLDSVIADIEEGTISQMLIFRRAFVGAHLAMLSGSSPNFQDFILNMTKTRLAAPFYVIAAGSHHGEGVVIARNLVGSDNTTTFGPEWFLCQCNTDRWLPDDPTDPRRTASEKLLQHLGAEEGTSQLGLFAVLSAYPVKNPHTAFTAIMSASTGEFHAYVRQASCPVDPSASIVEEKRYCNGKNDASISV